MDNIIKTFNNRNDEWLNALFQHLQISLISLFIAMIIAIPFGILIVKRKKITEFVLQITGILQTIPSLALLGLFIPILGIGRIPAIVALVIYGLFPILQNTITGLNSIDPILNEAATAFGMNRWEKLKKFELPLAIPSIIGGVRTSSVMLIGTATLAALVGAGGLGSFILLGIDRNDSALILIGAISSAILAIVINAIIKFLENKRLKVIFTAFLLTLALLFTSLFSFGLNQKNTLIAAGKLGPEPEILINMYKELIEAESDIKVELKPSFGKTSFLYKALKGGSIDLYPEFTGTVTSTLLNNKPKNIGTDARKVYEIARDGILEQDNLVLLEPMKFQNTYALAVRKSYAESEKLANISDLIKVEKSIKAGFTLEFNDREDGNRGLKSLYNLNLNVLTMEPALRYQAIENKDIDITDVYSTDPDIIKRNLTMLEDDKNLFPPYQGAPLLRVETLEKYPNLKDILDKLSNKISTEEMLEMNFEVAVNGKDANEVAKNYLLKNGLLKGE